MAIATKEVTLDHDEGPQPDTTLEGLAALQPVIPKQHNLAMSDIHLRELRETYAVTTLYKQTQVETPWDITNVSGGAVALGLPYGMTGIRYLGQALMELGRRGAHKAIFGVCTAARPRQLLGQACSRKLVIR